MNAIGLRTMPSGDAANEALAGAATLGTIAGCAANAIKNAASIGSSIPEFNRDRKAAGFGAAAKNLMFNGKPGSLAADKAKADAAEAASANADSAKTAENKPKMYGKADIANGNAVSKDQKALGGAGAALGTVNKDGQLETPSGGGANAVDADGNKIDGAHGAIVGADGKPIPNASIAPVDADGHKIDGAGVAAFDKESVQPLVIQMLMAVLLQVPDWAQLMLTAMK